MRVLVAVLLALFVTILPAASPAQAATATDTVMQYATPNRDCGGVRASFDYPANGTAIARGTTFSYMVRQSCLSADHRLWIVIQDSGGRYTKVLNYPVYTAYSRQNTVIPAGSITFSYAGAGNYDLLLVDTGLSGSVEMNGAPGSSGRLPADSSVTARTGLVFVG